MANSRSKDILNLFRAREELFTNQLVINPFVQKVLDKKLDKEDLWARKIQESLITNPMPKPIQGQYLSKFDFERLKKSM